MRLLLQGTSLDFSKRVHLMGILNVTPDSFSDGGEYTLEENILSHVQRMINQGADIIDIGGESTRPFAEAVDLEEELRRVIPAIRAIRQHSSIPISIDTTKSKVASQALLAGADIINDISALRFDPAMVDIALEHSAPIIIMHMQGTPADMQVNPTYDDVIEETISFFKERISWLVSKGIPAEKVIIDPGIGFGKTVNHNLLILKRAKEFKSLGCPVLIGHSRKSFLGKVLNKDVDDRDLSTAIISSYLADKQVSILRVHNVGATREALELNNALAAAN